MGFDIRGRFGHGKMTAMQLQVEILTVHPVAGAPWAKGLVLLIIVTGTPTEAVGTSTATTVPSRKLFSLLSQEYLEKNQQSPPSPQCFLTGIVEWGGDVKAAGVARTIWPRHLSPC